MAVVLVEGESDRIAVEVIAQRLGVRLPWVIVTGGAGGARRAARDLGGERLLGLVDAAERSQYARVMREVFVCEPDLEGEFVRALGVDAVLDVLAAQGDLASFRVLQTQPAQRVRSIEAQLARFFGGRSGNKPRYARALAASVPLERVPRPVRALITAAGE
jgi:hypothetical protein